MKKKLFQIGFILLLAILVSTGINFSLKKNQSNFSLTYNCNNVIIILLE